ncbi:permease prefix domain 2-containing transporter [Fibrella aquatilis]|uniref:ABC transporter permease n=1 Tax=Fibrella aquatilis TaxID=2817059 RepID=A0A939G2T9_9BACT|nr:permease prefix domain 2-containing transporter [Fibrella aquatilis]MBO0930856.1 ABC transporter permease [Fibrella aquatilis]
MNTSTPQPPRWATRLLHWFCSPHRLEEMDGDLDELFQQRLATVGVREARWRYIRDVLSLLQPSLLTRQATDYSTPATTTMLRNYLMIAFRSLWKNRVYSAISTVGLATGLTVTLLIVLYVAHEYSFDRFHTQGDHIVKVELSHTDGDRSYTIPWMSYRFGEAVKNACPEVADVARIRNEQSSSVPVQSDNQHHFFEADFRFADAGFVRLFSFSFVAGDPKTALTRPATVLLTERMARKYFGNADPIGRTIQYDKKYSFEVVGVVKDPPPNSSIHFDFLAQIDASRAIDKARYTEFGFGSAKEITEQLESVGADGSYHTYFLLHPAASLTNVLAKIPTVLTPKQRLKDTNDHFKLYPLFDVHFTVDQPAAKARATIFAVVALFVLALALINYVNLATARATNRAKEVSVRKVAGAGRSSLMAQFYVESTVQIVLAFVLAMVLFALLLPLFADIMQLQFDVSFLQTRFFVIPAVFFFGCCVLLSGGYPALVLAYFPVVFGLKSRSGSRQSTGRVRAGLTVFQFVVSIALIIGSMLMKQQLDLFLNKDIGVNRDRVLTIPLNREEGLATHFKAIRQDISQLPGVERVTASSLVMYDNYMNGWELIRKDVLRKVSVNTFVVDDQFIATMQLAWAIPPPDGIPHGEQLIINETAARQLGINAKNYRQTLDIGNGMTKELVGVVKDFNYSALHRAIGPMAFFVTHDTTAQNYLYVKLARNAPAAQTLAGLNQVYDRYKKERPFDYAYLDNTYRKLYQYEISTGRIILAFTLFAILISCLGLFGLATFTAEQRTKEIGVRKVLGASVASIVALLGGDFLRLVLVAILIASPLAWWAMHHWLADFAYKITIEWWVFALAGVLAVGIALLTVSFQSIRAALMNPVKSLRSE